MSGIHRMARMGWVGSTTMSITIGLLVASCGGGDSTTSASQDSMASTTSTTIVDVTLDSTTTSTSTISPDSEPDTLAITEIIELPNLTIHVDPLALNLDETAGVIDVLAEVLSSLPLQTPADAVLYGSSDESIDWAVDTTRRLDCLYSDDRALYEYVGRGAPCGFVMRVDAMAIDCYGNEPPCKNGLTVAAHEFFHTVTDQRLEACVCEPLIFGNKIPNWYAEGIADYVGYRTVFDDDPSWLTKVLEIELPRATNPDVAVGLIDMELLWAEGPSQPWFQYLYERSFFAIALLVEQHGESAVLDAFFDEAAKAGDFPKGFEATFGKTEAQFSDEFLAWIDTL